MRKTIFNGVPFFQTTFGEWFRDQEEKHRQNQLRTIPNSQISKSEVEADLIWRDIFGKEE